MDKTLYTSCIVSKDGRLALSEYDRVDLAARFGEKKVEVRVKTLSPKRSLAANNYYWGCLVTSIADYTGYTKEEAHLLLKSRFASEIDYIVNEATGEVIETSVPRQTRTMTKAEFAEFIDQVETFCVSLGIMLPSYQGDRYAYAEHD